MEEKDLLKRVEMLEKQQHSLLVALLHAENIC